MKAIGLYLGGMVMVLSICFGLNALRSAGPQPAPAVRESVQKDPAPLAPLPLDFPPRSGVYRVLITEAVDGDTCHFYWLIPDMGRLAGINAPELHGDHAKAGEAAKVFLQSKLSKTPMTIKVTGKEKYGRTMLIIFDDKGQSLNQTMIDSGNAVSWDGSGKRPE